MRSYTWAGLWVLVACSGVSLEDGPVAEQQLALTCTKVFQNGVAPTSSYSGNKDTTLKEAEPNANFHTNVLSSIIGSDERAFVLKWDVSAIPPSATVVSATLGVEVQSSTVEDYQVYEVKRVWAAPQATWNVAVVGPSGAWQVPGAQGASDRGSLVGTLGGDGLTGAHVVPFNSSGIAMVQSWVSTQVSHGVIIANPSNTDSVMIHTADASTVSKRPRLSVTYTTAGSGGVGGGSGC
jgi:hypothetical protein